MRKFLMKRFKNVRVECKNKSKKSKKRLKLKLFKDLKKENQSEILRLKA